MGEFDVEAALRRHSAIPQTRDRRYNTKLTHYGDVNLVAANSRVVAQLV